MSLASHARDARAWGIQISRALLTDFAAICEVFGWEDSVFGAIYGTCGDSRQLMERSSRGWEG